MNQGASSQGVSLHDLIALNDEIVAMVRAGVPLDQGLLQLSGDLPRRLGELASQLGQRLQGGQELTRILADDTLAFPPVWKVMVATGVRTGHLTEVLECLAAAGRRAAEMRRTIALAFVYPTLVWILAYATLVLLTTCLAPILDGALRDLTSHAEPLARCLAWLGEHLVWWVAAPPALFCLPLDQSNVTRTRALR